jgi:S1-C subfamily serine protease
MAGRTRFVAATAGIVAAAVLGGGLALGGAALLGDLGSTTTTIREVQAAASPATSSRPATTGALPINDIYARAAPGVVQVTSTTIVNVPADPFFGAPFFPQQQRQQSLGSGFVVDKAGHIVTNYHVIEGAKQVRVSFSNGSSMKATVVGSDPSSDLAVLKIDASSRALTPLTLGNSDAVRVGDPVVAIGNPFGLDRTVTAGIVSAIQRAIAAPNGYTIDHVIQTDAAINHGNSGGPLLDSRGEVIGVNSQIETGDNSSSSGNVGIGFAVPSNTVKTVMAQLIREGHVDRAFIGVGAVPITKQLAQVFRLPVSRGLLVQSVQPGSGAAKAGMRAGTTQVVLAGESYNLGGDIIVSAGGTPVASLDRLRDIVAARKPGETLRLVVYRGGKKTNVDVKLGRQPVNQTG